MCLGFLLPYSDNLNVQNRTIISKGIVLSQPKLSEAIAEYDCKRY